MSKRAAQLVRGGLVLVGATGAGLGCTYVYKTYFKDPPSRNEGLVRIAAIALSSEVVNNTLNNTEVQDELVGFVKQVFIDKRFVRVLKDLCISEFTDDTPTRRALKQFIVRDVIMDTWVADELIDMAKDLGDGVRYDPDIYPAPVLSWLGDRALCALKSDEFHRGLCSAIWVALWKALIGPPPEYLLFSRWNDARSPRLMELRST